MEIPVIAFWRQGQKLRLFFDFGNNPEWPVELWDDATLAACMVSKNQFHSGNNIPNLEYRLSFHPSLVSTTDTNQEMRLVMDLTVVMAMHVNMLLRWINNSVDWLCLIDRLLFDFADSNGLEPVVIDLRFGLKFWTWVKHTCVQLHTSMYQKIGAPL